MKTKEMKGITLVALVVTIVVLLILAGVSINLVLGDNGIIAKAKEAQRKSAEASQNDLIGMNELAQQLEEKINGSTGNGGKTEPETVPYLPSDDFHYDTSTSVDTGLVIKDANGNEYVWVVVPKSLYNNTNYNSNNAKRPSSSTDYANIKYCLQQYTATYRVRYFDDVYYPDDKNVGWFADETAYNNLKNSMLKSVYENGGFYIGRYEAGIEITGTNKTSRGPTNSDGKYTIEGMPTPVSKADAYPYTYVTRTQAQNLASNVNSGTKTSSLMFGVQWDLVLAFMRKDTTKITDTSTLTSDSTTIGNYLNSTFDLSRGKYARYDYVEDPWKNFDSALGSIVVSNETTGKMKKTEQSSFSNSILLTTGGTEQSKVMNIYDIAGNVCEWTLEKASGDGLPCVMRGGNYTNNGSDNPVAHHSDNYTTNAYYGVGFRLSLW